MLVKLREINNLVTKWFQGREGVAGASRLLTGLIERCKKSSLLLKAAEDQLLKFLEEHTEKGM
ncbi:hypothetical protein E2C01_075385 [Portunus trituberculatus]|uniref:Uncharacterized protein n=1 Tax=Portunus trituberculatus TaxID=210409 RepID=A0A5B7IAK4_PORTR|nr:hypothetical protein [Portunus trituberculatus]